MKTEAFIAILARGAGPAPRSAAAKKLTLAAGAGLLASSGLALRFIGPIPAAMLLGSALWIKLVYAIALAGAAGWATARLSRPIARLSAPRQAVIGVIAAMALLGSAYVLSAPEGKRVAAMLGKTWFSCPWNVVFLSLPALACILWAVRSLAPTRPRLAGLVAGLFAGALGAAGYAFACLELSPTFVSIWYSLGIGMTALIGAALGPYVLRW